MCNTLAKRDQLARVKKQVSNPLLPKEAKESYLREQRQLEKELGLPSTPYNGIAFSS